MGDCVGNGRLIAAPWTSETAQYVGDQILESTPDTWRFVCTESPRHVEMASGGAGNFVASPPHGWGTQDAEARNVENFDWNAEAGGLYRGTGVPVCTKIGYAGFMAYVFVPEVGDYRLRFSIFGHACVTGSTVEVVVGRYADLTADGNFGGAEEFTYSIPVGNANAYPVGSRVGVDFDETMAIADVNQRAIVIRFDSSTAISNVYENIPNVLISTAPRLNLPPPGGLTGSTEPNWASVSVGGTIVDGDITWTRVPNDRSVDCETDRYICSVAGWSDGPGFGTEPDWPDSIGQSVADGQVRWTRINGAAVADGLLPMEAVLQGIIDDAVNDGDLSDPPVLATATTPGFSVRPFVKEQMSALDAMRALAAIIGWDLRLAYFDAQSDDEVWGRWRLSLFAPDRETTTALATFTADQYLPVRRGRQSLDTIRNRVEITYCDWSNMDPDGVNAPQRRVTYEDATSIAKYGVQWMGLGAGSANEVNSLTEAARLGAAILDDLAEPVADIEIELPLRWWVELGDLYEFGADGRVWTSAQKLAVVGWKHQIRKGSAVTGLQVRGKPSAGVRRWHDRGVGPGKATPSAHEALQTSTPDVTTAVNGGIIKFDPPPQQNRPGSSGGFAKAELHLSQTNGFTPSASTLKSISTSTRFDITGLLAGVTYYGRIICIDARGNRSAPSPQFTLRPTGQFGCQLSVASDATGTETGDVIAFDTADTDPASMLDDDRIGIVAPADGIYDVSATARLTGLDSAGDNALLVIKVNGSAAYSGPSTLIFGDGLVSARCLLELAEDDTVRVYLTTDSTCTVKAGATLTVTRTLIDPAA